MTDQTDAQNRATFNAFIDMFFRQGLVTDAFRVHVAEDYVQHNPMAADGRDNAIAMLEGLKKASPDFTLDIKRIVIEGDLCCVHSHGRVNPDDSGLSVMDIFRAANGKIVEHWDVLQPVPEKSANANGMF